MIKKAKHKGKYISYMRDNQKQPEEKHIKRRKTDESKGIMKGGYR